MRPLAACARRRCADEGGAFGTGRRAAGTAPARLGGRAALGRGALLLLVALAAACARDASSAAAGGTPAAAPHAVVYALDWARDDVATSPGDPGFTVTNDLGYVVHVTRGWITSYGVELVECPPAATATPVARLSALLWSTLEGTAWAGHGTDTPNPAAIRPMQIESITEPTAQDVASLTLPPQAYCKLHYLLARAGAEARGLPSEPDLVGTSLHVEGTYRAPGSTTAVPFTLRGASAYGVLVEQAGADAAALHVDTGRGATRVIVRRHRARMFDGVDFANMPERAAALQVLRALVDHVDVRLEPAAGAGAT